MQRLRRPVRGIGGVVGGWPQVCFFWTSHPGPAPETWLFADDRTSPG